MAKYTVKYACGHGSTEEQLYGPEKDRQRKIKWMEANRVCRDCYIADSKRRDAEAERIVHVALDGVSGVLVARISGGVDTNRDAFKGLGYTWSRDHGGTIGLFATREPPLMLCKTHPYQSEAAALAWADGIQGELDSLGYKLRVEINPLDIDMMRRTLAKRAEDQKARDAAAAAPRPKRPEWLQAIFDVAGAGGRWNGTVYGGPGRRAIYVGGEKQAITDAQAIEAGKYWAALMAHRAATKA